MKPIATFKGSGISQGVINLHEPGKTCCDECKQETSCDVCGRSDMPLLEVNGAADEYRGGFICQRCTEAAFAQGPTLHELAIAIRKRTASWPDWKQRAAVAGLFTPPECTHGTRITSRCYKCEPYRTATARFDTGSGRLLVIVDIRPDRGWLLTTPVVRIAPKFWRWA